MRGRKPLPTAVKRVSGNPGKRGYNHAEPRPPEGLPDCPPHLSAVAKAEWDRIAGTLYDMGVLTTVDRAALAAYCQAYARWVEAEEKLKETPVMLKTPSGYVQQSPWLSVSNKQLELMGRYMAELGITPASRSRVASVSSLPDNELKVVRIIIGGEDSAYTGLEGTVRDRDGNPVEDENAIRLPSGWKQV